MTHQTLCPYGHHHWQFIPGLWKHTWRPITFLLVIDNFDIKFTGVSNGAHLLHALKNWYELTAVDPFPVVRESKGILKSKHVKSACQTTSKRHLPNINSHPQPTNNIHPTKIFQLNTDKHHKKPSLTCPNHSTTMASNTSKMSWTHSSTLYTQLTHPCFCTEYHCLPSSQRY